MPTKIFTVPGNYAAWHAAESWLTTRGFSIGRMQGPDPRGIIHGDYDIQKWHNLNHAERAALDGTMAGSMRNGPITVTLLPTARNEAVAAFLREDDMAHTPGPWQVMPIRRAVHAWIIADKDGGSLADCSPPGPWMPYLEADANARLIAAAPDMLAVAEEFDRLSLVIESAARNEHQVNPSACARIVAAIKANRAAIKSAKEES